MPKKKYKKSQQNKLARLQLNSTQIIKKEPIIKSHQKIDGIELKKNLKAPICCVLGHVDAGKTKLLDKMRKTQIGKNEKGGITQNIGSSFFPIESIRTITKAIKGKFSVSHHIPGLLMIDTPGHEVFSNLRTRGTSLCDLAILVVDIMEGLQKQTIEAIELLKEKNVPFIIALNKVDMIWGWESYVNLPLRRTLKKQKKETASTLEGYVSGIKEELMKNKIKSEFYFKNKSPEKIYSIIPVSAETGEGIPDLLAMLVFLTQNWLQKKIIFDENKVKASIMEVSRDNKLGWTMDIILANGILKIGDKIVVGTQNGSKVVSIKNMMLPPPLQETKSKVKWIYKKEIKASAGIKIIASDLENVLAGTHMIVVKNNNEEKAKIRIEKEINEIYAQLSFQDRGIWISVKTLGSLEAFYTLLQGSKIPLRGYFIGKFTSKELSRIISLYEDEVLTEYRTVLHYGEDLNSELIKEAKDNNFNLISSEVVYHLLEKYDKLKEESIEQRKTKLSDKGSVVFPCILKILKQYIFNKKDPIIIGVKIKDGTLKKGTPLIISKKNLMIGNVISIQHNNKELEEAAKGKEVCIKIKPIKSTLTYGRHFDHTDPLISHITMDSYKLLRQYFKNIISKEEKILLKKIMIELDVI